MTALHLTLDTRSDTPLYRQIVDRVWTDVASGAIEPGARLPTVRQLAIDLSVHPNTVARAYEQLELLGVLITRPGQGTFVCLTAADRPAAQRRLQLEQLCRRTLEEAQALGFSLDDVRDMLNECRPTSPDDGEGVE